MLQAAIAALHSSVKESHRSATDRLRSSHLLGVKATVVAAQVDVAQLFLLRLEGGHYNAVNFRSADVGPGGLVKFIPQSPIGFSDPFRFDPLRASQQSAQSNMTSTCIEGKNP